MLLYFAYRDGDDALGIQRDGITAVEYYEKAIQVANTIDDLIYVYDCK